MTNQSDTIAGELRRIYLFEALDDEQLDAVVRSTQLLHLQPRQGLFEFGQPASRFYYVRKGHIKLFRLSAEGDEKVISVFMPGQTFAEAVMFIGRRQYPVSAEAIDETELYGFDMETFSDLLQHSVPTCFHLMGSMSQKLHARVEEINNLTLQNATYRLVYYLLQQLSEAQSDRATVHLDTPKGVIASQLSIQPETLSRILANLGKKGLLSVKGSDVLLHDVQALRRILSE